MWRGLLATKRIFSAVILVQIFGLVTAHSQLPFTSFWKQHTIWPDFTWIGNGGNSNWNTAGNWAGGVVPGASDTAHFVQAACRNNCNATMNVAVNIAGMDMQASYLGTITQGASTVTVGAAGWTQANGIFAGGSGTITLNGNFAQSGGTFTSTSGTMTVTTNYTLSGTASFVHNSGTISFSPTASSPTIQTGTISFYNVNFTGSGQNLTLTGNAITVLGALGIGDVTTIGSTITGGTIAAKGNVSFSGNGYLGSYAITVSGSANQAVTGVSTAVIPSFQIASTGGTVTLSGTLVFIGDYTYTSGTVVASTGLNTSSAVAISQGPALYYALDETSGTAVADSSGSGANGTLSGTVTLGATGREGTNFQFSSTGKITLNSNLPLGASSTISAWVKVPLPNNGSWKTVTRGVSDHQMIFNSSTNEFGAYFNYNSAGFRGSGVLANSLAAGWHHFTVVQTGGNTAFYVDGSYVSTTAGQPTDSVVTIGNYVSGGQGVPDLDGVAIFSRALSAAEISLQASPVAGAASTIIFQSAAGSPTIIPGNSVSYYNVNFAGADSNYTLSGTLNVLGTLNMGDTTQAHKTITSGTINAKGAVNFLNYGYDGTALLKIGGISNQTVTGSASASIPNFEIASTGGIVTLASTLHLSSNYTWTSGTVSGGSSTVYFDTPASAYTVVPGTTAFNNVTFAGVSSAAVATMTGTMTVNGTLTFASSTTAGSVNGGGFSVAGNVVFSGAGETGTATLALTGSSNTSVTIGGAASVLTGAVTVNKSASSTVSLNSTALFNSAGQSMTITSGIVDMAGYNLTINSNLTVSASGSLYCNGGILSKGSLTNNGVMDCAGIGFAWTGANGDGNWNTAGNWSGGVIPGAGNIVVFGNLCGSGAACNATINANVSVGGLRMLNAYPGTLTQASGRTVTVGTSGWYQSVGTFVGGNSTIVMNGVFSLSGGSFTSTSGSLQIYTSFTRAATATFLHNSGNTTFNANGSYSITTNNINFYNLAFVDYLYAAGSTSLVDDFTIDGSLTLDSNRPWWVGASYTVIPSAAGPRIISLIGNLNVNCGSGCELGLTFGNSNLTLSLIGSTNQALSRTLNAGNGSVMGGILKVNKSAGIAYLATNNYFGGLDLPTGQTFDTSPDGGTTSYNVTFAGTFTRVGTFLARAGTVTFITAVPAYTITTNNLSFNNLAFSDPSWSGQNITLGDDFSILGNLTIDSARPSWANPGFGVYASATRVVNLDGNLNVNNSGGGLGLTFGNTNLTLSLTGSTDQALSRTLTSGAGSLMSAKLKVNKSAGIAYLATSNNSFGGLDLPAGQTFDTSPDGGTTSYNVTFAGTFTRVGTFLVRAGSVSFTTDQSYTITTNNLSFNNLAFYNSASTKTVTLADDFSVLGNLTVSSYLASWAVPYGMVLPSGTRAINLYGNLVVNKPASTGALYFGTTGLTVNMVGSTDQTLTQTGGEFWAKLRINQTGAVSTKLATAFSMAGAGQNVTITQTSLDMQGFAFSANSLTLAGSTSVTKGGGVLTINGSAIGAGAYSGGTVNP